jgi:hypothetical protein
MAKKKASVEATVRDIRQKTRKKYSSEEKICVRRIERGKYSGRIMPSGRDGAEPVLQMEQRISGSGETTVVWEHKTPRAIT